MSLLSSKTNISTAVLFCCFFILSAAYARPSTGDTVLQKIGVAGGSLTSNNKQVTVNVLPGAMAKEEIMNLYLTSNNAPNGNGYAYRIQSSSPVKKPFSICWKLNKEQSKLAKEKTLAIAYQNGQQSWLASKKFQLNEHDSTICFELKDVKSTSTTVTVISEYMMIPETDLGQPILVNQPVLIKITGVKISNEWATISKGSIIKDEIEELYVNGNKSGEGDMKDGSISEAAYSLPYSALYVAASHVPEINPIIVKAAIRTGPGQVIMLETPFTIKQNITMSSSVGKLINPISVFTAMQGGPFTVSASSDIETNDAVAVNVMMKSFTKEQSDYDAGPDIVFSLTGNGRVFSSDYYERENGVVVKKYSNAKFTVISLTPLEHHPGNAVLEGKLEADLYHSAGSTNEKATVSVNIRMIGTYLQ